MSSEFKKIFPILLLLGCSKPEKAEQQRLRQHHAHGESIYRSHSDQQFDLPPPQLSAREKYPWEEKE